MTRLGRWPLIGLLVLIVGLLMGALGCGGPEAAQYLDGPDVMASTGYLADIVRNVSGSRLTVESLIPDGTDPHSFQPTPQDAAKLAGAGIIVIDTYGLGPSIDKMIESTGGSGRVVVEAAAGVKPRGLDAGSAIEGHDGDLQEDLDPHFWLDPINILTYVDNIREALTLVDPEGGDTYALNAEAYKAQLRALDEWINGRVATIPRERRLLVTNHESFGYFADRYEFTVVGTIFPSLASGGSPSARQLADLIEAIRAAGAPAIFLEAGGSVEIAEQVGRETGAEVVTDLLTHTVGDDATTYVDMMKWNVERIAGALE